jgi:hypothetical protein
MDNKLDKFFSRRISASVPAPTLAIVTVSTGNGRLRPTFANTAGNVAALLSISGMLDANGAGG